MQQHPDLAHLAQHAIILPHLKVLVSSLNSREYAPALLAGRGNFLATHPTIEELSWYHDSPVTFPKDGVFLPNLRRLRAHRDFVIRLVNRRGAPDELTIDCVDTRTLCLLVGLGRGIRKLVIDEIQGGTLPYLAEFNEFPNLRVLSVSRTRGGENVHFWNLNKMAEFLRSFPLIEAFQIESKGIWDIFDVPKKPSIHSLVDRCPNLRILNIQRPLYTESKSIEIKDKIGGYEVSSTGRRSVLSNSYQHAFHVYYQVVMVIFRW
ncbi:hypothetical protein BDN72DRAFT_654374 [Pluteus cervinus]|uniref:Uncharacterized protein n=1 Tax=Pluteus cervinus TaxID=181527 RepID=A0ACD3ATA9_9AGAR|nr:hypothetical protein BDN72DRAFT_654374 [Pluteus cervinus]